MWSFFKQTEEVVEKEVIDPRPPIGAMFEDEDRDGSFIIVTKHLKMPDRDYEDSMKMEFFPSTTNSGMKMSMHYLNDKYKRMTPEQEKKWNEEYFANKEAYFAKEAEAKYDSDIKKQEALVNKHEIYYKQQAKALEKKLDTTKDKFIVIHSGSCDVLESLLNRAAKKRFKVIFTSHTEQHWFMAVLEKK